MKKISILTLLFIIAALLCSCAAWEPSPVKISELDIDGEQTEDTDKPEDAVPVTPEDPDPVEPDTDDTEDTEDTDGGDDTGDTENPTTPTEDTEKKDDNTNPTDPTPAAPAPTFTETNDTVYVKEGGVNIREGYSTASKVVKAVTGGTALKRLATGSNGWDKIEYNGKILYVNTKYITTTAPEEKKDDEKKEEGSEGGEGGSEGGSEEN